MKRSILPILFLLCSAFVARSQDVALKSNLLMDGFLNPNIGVEVSVAPKWSIELTGQGNFWTLSDGKKWKHWLLQPEARYWFCQAFDGHFIAVHAIGGVFNVGHINLPFSAFGHNFRTMRDNRYQGWAVGGGIAYGYSWALSKHWNIEAELGLGYAHTRYDVFECVGCGRKTAAGRHRNYVGPTKAAVNLVYVF